MAWKAGDGRVGEEGMGREVCREKRKVQLVYSTENTEESGEDGARKGGECHRDVGLCVLEKVGGEPLRVLGTDVTQPRGTSDTAWKVDWRGGGAEPGCCMNSGGWPLPRCPLSHFPPFDLCLLEYSFLSSPLAAA